MNSALKKVGTTWHGRGGKVRYRILAINGEYCQVYVFHRLNATSNRITKRRLSFLKYPVK